jgi:hypothetical protein
MKTLLLAVCRPVGWRAVAAVALSVFCAVASAQLAGKGGVSGVVTDSQGAAISNAEVDVTKVATGVVTKTTSTSSGDYNISTLDPGEYTVTVSAPGFEKLTQLHVQVNALEVVTVSPKLTPGGATETVTVTSQPPQLETTNATLGATLDNDMYSALPIEMGAYGQADQRRATDFAFLMPGVQGNNTNGNPTTNAGIVNGSGSRGAVTAIYIDGVVFVRAGGNGDPRYIWTAVSVDAVDQFQLQTNGYSAMYEGQGIQNYTIKQGGNKYHGAVYEFFRNTALDTWGFFGPGVTNPITGLPQKPIEHSNEYGIYISGPLVPFGSWKDKLFFFANYDGFRYASETPTQNTFPNSAEQGGNFLGVGKIYDPASTASCTAHNGGFPCRYEFGYGPGTATTQSTSNPGNAVATGAPIDQIPANRLSTEALAMQNFFPQLSSQNITNNYNAPNRTGLNNWSHTERVDWLVTPKDQVTFTAALGRQASSFPVGQATIGRNVGPLPYNYGQAYAPKTAVGIVEETHTFTPHIINQLKYGFARYNGPTFNADNQAQYGASSLIGITGIPSGQASNAFPITTFSGNNPPTNWGGTTASVTIAQNYTLVDNVQWQFGKHNLTIGAQIAWLQYLNQPATTGTTPLTLATSSNETGQYVQKAGVGSYAITSGTGLAYASLLLGQVDKASFTEYAVQEFASRFRAISPYVQDNWKVSSKLTLDLGLRWDYFPPVREVKDNMSFFSPSVTNSVTQTPGGLVFAGNGAGTCNCRTPIKNYYKNFGPRIGFAYQSDERTVWRGSFGVMFTHGNAVGGGTPSGLGGSNVSQGFSATGSTGTTSDTQAVFILGNSTTAFPPSYLPTPLGRASGTGYASGNTSLPGYTSTSPSSISYLDPYFGSRAPEYENWSFGFQHQWTNSFTSTITYVGSQGHFLVSDGSNPRGYWSDGLDPNYLQYNSDLSDNGTTNTTLSAFCASHSGVCPSYYTLANSATTLATILKPFPFQGVSDTAGNVANANYHALQTMFQMRPSHHLTFMANYTWSRSIDDGGTFRSGYPIPQQYSNTDKSWKADRIERSVSTSNQPHHFVLTGVYDLPFGRDFLNSNEIERAVLGGFKLSTIFQAFSGSPLAITQSSCTNPAEPTCMPNYNPAYPLSKNVRINGKYGTGVTWKNAGTRQFIDGTAFVGPANYTFGNLSRTAAYNLYGPGNYQWDLSLRRSFALHITESSKFNFQADLYNVTNHTFFAISSTSWGVGNSNASFGTLTTNPNYNRRAAQLSARLEF